MVTRDPRLVARRACGVLVLCATVHGAAAAPARLTGTWQVRAVDERSVLEQPLPILVFEQPGHIAGSAGCNRYSGTLVVHGATVRLGPLAVGRMACAPQRMELEARLLRSLQGADTLIWAADGSGILSGPEGRSLRFVQQPEHLPAGGAIAHQGVSPSPTAYRCGAEILKIAFEAGAAYVGLPDGSQWTLPLQDPAQAPSARVYTNGRLTLFQTPGAKPLVQRAHGRMAPEDCSPLP